MLTDIDKATLDLEHQWFRYPAVKETRVRDLFGESITRYYQRLNVLIDRPEALAHDPVLVRRLRRLREQRQATRTRAAGTHGLG